MKALIEVHREIYRDKVIIGRMFINGQFQCFTLEDVSRDLNRDGDLNDKGEEKVYGQTAIPAGTYRMIINMSNRFKKEMPLLIDVPGFEGIRIHAGNTHADTHGCILVGQIPRQDTIEKSVLAFNALMKELSKYREYEIRVIDKSIA